MTQESLLIFKNDNIENKYAQKGVFKDMYDCTLKFYKMIREGLKINLIY